jgi:hypothetical protein
MVFTFILNENSIEYHKITLKIVGIFYYILVEFLNNRFIIRLKLSLDSNMHLVVVG